MDNKTKLDIIQQVEAAIKKEKDEEKATQEEEDKAQLKKVRVGVKVIMRVKVRGLS